MALLRWVMVFMAGMAWLSAHAGTKVINVELGASTLEQVRKEAASAGRIGEDQGGGQLHRHNFPSPTRPTP